MDSDWRTRIGSLPHKSASEIFSRMHMPYKVASLSSSFNLYLDGSRKFAMDKAWDGWMEWMFGDEEAGAERNEECVKKMQAELTKVQILSDAGEFQILGHDVQGRAIWLLVAMDGVSSGFSRGHVGWTKVMHGASSCQLHDATEMRKKQVVANVLQEQLGKKVRIRAMVSREKEAIEWT